MEADSDKLDASTADKLFRVHSRVPVLLHRSQEQARCVDVFGRRHTTDGAVCPPEVKGKRALPLGDLPGQFRRSVPVQVQGHR